MKRMLDWLLFLVVALLALAYCPWGWPMVIVLAIVSFLLLPNQQT